jgi:PilZ domain
MANDKRRMPRQTLNVSAWIDTGDDTQPVRCTVVDISETGARLAVSDSVSTPDQFDLIVSRAGNPGRPCTVVWRLHGLLGIEFTAPTPAGAGSPAAGDSAAPLAQKISALFAGGLRRIRTPLGM